MNTSSIKVHWTNFESPDFRVQENKYTAMSHSEEIENINYLVHSIYTRKKKYGAMTSHIIRNTKTNLYQNDDFSADSSTWIYLYHWDQIWNLYSQKWWFEPAEMRHPNFPEPWEVEKTYT